VGYICFWKEKKILTKREKLSYQKNGLTYFFCNPLHISQLAPGAIAAFLAVESPREPDGAVIASV